MKRIIKWVLLGLNGLLIAMLLLFSCFLFYFSAAKPAAFFGYKAILLDQSFQQEEDEVFCLLQVYPSSLSDGDLIILEETEGATLYSVKQIDGQFFYQTAKGDLISVSLSSDSFTGRVVYQNWALGRLLAAAASPDNLLFTYLIIGGGFVLAALILFGLYLLSTRRISVLSEEEEEQILSDASPDSPLRSDLSTQNDNSANFLLNEESAPKQAVWEPWRPSRRFSQQTVTDEPQSAIEKSSSVSAAKGETSEEISFQVTLPSAPNPSTRLPASAETVKDEPKPSEKTAVEETMEWMLDDIVKEFRDGLMK